jgi:hypothetical protein
VTTLSRVLSGLHLGTLLWTGKLARGGDRRHGTAAGRGAHHVFASIAVGRGCKRAAVILELHAVG